MCYLIYPSTTEYGGDVLFVYLIDGERGADRVGNLFGPFPGGIWFSPGLSEHKAICFQKAPGSPHSVSSIFWEGSRKTLEKNCDNFIGWPHSFFKKMCVMCLCVKNRQDLCPGAIPVSGSRDESALVRLTHRGAQYTIIHVNLRVQNAQFSLHLLVSVACFRRAQKLETIENFLFGRKIFVY